jgi:antitoxin (DNA-binding transcriptional repressor) of toxin-antitoxin stability system
MKVIELSEAKANLEQYAQECQSSPVVVTVDGKPLFELIPVRSEDPDFLDRLLDSNAAFRDLLAARRRESDSGRVSSLEEVRQRLKGASQQWTSGV